MSQKGESWSKLLDRSSNQSKVTYTTDPLTMYCIASNRKPFGFGFRNSIVNKALIEVIKKHRSPTDNWTYLFKWYGKEAYWAQLLSNGNPGFCKVTHVAAQPSSPCLICD